MDQPRVVVCETLLDASTAINLVSGSILHAVLALEGTRVGMSSIALRECGNPTGDVLARAIESARLAFVDSTELSSVEFLSRLSDWRLGEGEVETILMAKMRGSAVATDDLAARKRVEDFLGAERLIGSIGFMRQLVRRKVITVEAAMRSYEQMRVAGAFLPKICAKDLEV